MKKLLCLAAALALPAHAGENKSTAWDIVADLTTEVGPRLAGTEAEARARDWAKARLTALGFANIAIEPFTIRGYVRGGDRAQMVAPYPQKFVVTALGYSGATPPKGIEGDLVYFQTLDALKAAADGSLKDKIAFVDHALKANQDGSGYGPYGDVRRKGPAIAAGKGAIAIVIRSIGTDHHRNPHAGATSFSDGMKAIPAAAISNPDADIVARVAASGKPMRLSLTLTGHTQEGMPSGNVIGELPGRDPSLPPILVGCHLDSWDLGTGAIDDGAGCAIITAAALRTQAGGKPLRTIRVLWAGSEELGGFGGIDYAKRHGAEPHALAMESDFGADRVWAVKIKMAAANKALGERIVSALNPIGVVFSASTPHGGTDIDAIAAQQKLAVIDLQQDGTRYFDIHHTPDDTLDKIDPAQLEQNVEAWATVLGIVANEPGAISGE